MNKVIRLEAQNIKKIKAIEIIPTGNQIIIGGMNGEGKTSILDCIEMAMRGKCGHKKPIRDGEDSGYVVLELEDIIVTRKFSGDRSTLVVASKDGAEFKRPQEMLDKLIGNLSFDPLAFSEMDAKDQAAALRKAMGVDTTSLDIERSQVFEKRTGVNREMKARKAEMDDAPIHKDLPDSIPSTDEIMSRIEQADKYRSNFSDRERDLQSLDTEIHDIESKIESLTNHLQEKKEQQKKWINQFESMPKPQDTESLKQQIRDADSIRQKQHENQRHAEKKAAYQAAKAESEALTKRLSEIDAEKLHLMESAHYPVPGIAIGESGLVEYNGIPFSQASAAERIRVGAAMALAMNPDLGVILIRDGSLMDAKCMDELHNFVKKHDAQVFIERVGNGDPMALIIEDGEIAKPEKGGSSE